MKRLLILVLLGSILTGTDLFSQFQTRQSINEFYQVDEYIKRQGRGDKYKLPDNSIGTPYNNPDYQLGNVYKENKLWASNVALRYNAVADEIEIKESLGTADEEARVLPRDPDIFVKIVDDIFIFVPFQGDVEKGNYFHILYEGKKLDLYKKIVKEVIPGRKASSSLTKDIPTEFRDKSQYFLITKSGRFYQLPDSKAKRLNVFGSNKELVRNYVEENDLDIDDEADLLKIIKYYDSI